MQWWELYQRSFQKRFGVLELSVLSVGLVILFKPTFLFDIEQGSDGWFNLGVSYFFPNNHENPLVFYRDERFVSTFPRWLMRQIFDHPYNRYAMTFISHYMILLGFSFVFRSLFTKAVTQFLVLLMAFSPLLMASYHTNYLAEDVLMYVVWTFAAVLRIPNAVRPAPVIRWSFLTGMLWALAFFTHLKVGLYTVFVPMLIFLDPFSLSFKKQWFRSGLGFLMGFSMIACLMAIVSRFLLNGGWFFFESQWHVALMDETNYNRPFIDVFFESPGFEIYAVTTALVLLRFLRRSATSFDFAWAVNLLILLVFAFFDGHYFVESNYSWYLPGLFVALGYFLELFKWDALKNNYATLCVFLFLPLFFVNDLMLRYDIAVLFERHIVELFFFVALLFFTAVFRLQRRCEGVAFFVLIPFVCAFHFTLRPDPSFGSTLFKEDFNRLEFATYTKKMFHNVDTMIQFIKNNREGWPMIYTGVPNDYLTEHTAQVTIQSSKWMDGRLFKDDYDPSGDQKNGRVLFYVTETADFRPVLDEIDAVGLKAEVLFVRQVTSDPSRFVTGLRLLLKSEEPTTSNP